MTKSTIQSPNKVLTVDDLPDLLDMLSSVKHKCIYIGLKLGVSYHAIQSVTMQHANHLDQLREILHHSLNQLPHLTVNDIVQTLTSRSVRENLVAREIQSHYGNEVLASASPQVSTEPLLHPFSTTAQLTLSPTPDLPTGSLASEAPSLRPEVGPAASSICNSPQAAHLAALTPYRTSSQPLATPTNRTYQHCTGQQLPHLQQHQPYYHHPNPHPSAFLPPSVDHYTLSTIPSTTAVNISRGSQMHLDTSHQPFSQDQPHFPSSNGNVQQVGQAPPNPHHGMTTHDHPYQVNPQQVSQCQSQQQDTSNHVSQIKSNDTSRAAFDCDTPPAKRVHLETPMDQFISYIKQTYRLCLIEKSLNVIKWPPTPSKIFINLACIDWRTVMTREEANEVTRAMVEDGNVDVIMKKKTPIEFSDIVQDLPDTALEKVILVEGAPGVGKSTFAWELCRRWERGEIAQQYRLVLLLRLRDDRISKAQNLRDLLYHPKDSVCDAVEENVIDTFGDKCLIILEGFDELPDTCRMESSLFLNLINGQLLPLATILVTSRPWAASALLDMCHHNIFKHIEILGFTETQIEKYVQSTFTDEKNPEKDPMQEKDIEDTMTYIAKYPQIKACMYIPLNSAIVVSVYKESKAGRCILPKTLTDLYYALTQTLLLRYLRGHPVHKKIRHIQSFEKDLPQEVYEQLLEISEIAYNGIYTDWGDSVQLIYSDLPPTFETLGLMQAVSQMYVTQGVNVSHNFLHLTVQEFLAALHISNMPPDKQLKQFKRHKEGQFGVVLRFLAGLTKLLNISLEQRRALLDKPHSISEEDATYTQMKSDVSASVHHVNWMFEAHSSVHDVNWMFEAHSSDVIKTWLEDKTVEFKFPRQMSPLEYYSAGYCTAQSGAHWVLTIQEHKEETDLKMFCDGITSTKEADFKIKLNVLVCMASEKLSTLLTKMGPHILELHTRLCDDNIAFENLSALRVLHLDLYSKGTFDLTTSFPSQSLESLTIAAGRSSRVLGLKSCVTIGELLTSAKYITHLHFSSARCRKREDQLYLESKGVEFIFKAMAGNTSLRSVEFPFTETIAELLPVFITSSTFLLNLHIGFHHKMQGKEIESIATALANNTSLPLKSLTLPTLKISDTAADSLVLFVQNCVTLEFVTWEEDKITLITACGLREMATAEHHYSWLPPAATRPLHHCVVSCIEDGIDFDHIWQHHSFCGTFTCHNIGDEGACSFGASLIKNSTVRELYFNSNHAHPALTKVLHHSTHQSPNKKISDAGATALAQALRHNSTLWKLDLSNNSVSDAGVTALAQALHHNSSLAGLNLSGNDAINEESTRELVHALTVNTCSEVWWTHWGGLVLPKRCEEFAIQCPEYVKVKTRVKFVWNESHT